MMYNNFVCKKQTGLVTLAKHIRILICLLCAVFVLGQGVLPCVEEVMENGSVCEFRAAVQGGARFVLLNPVRTSRPFKESRIVAAPVSEHNEENSFSYVSSDGLMFDANATVQSVCKAENSVRYSNIKKCFYLII